MKNTGLFVCLFLLVLGNNSLAQKMKYKDIFPLIQSKDYDSAIPKINAFLKDPKNAQHANANLQKGLYFEQKVAEFNIISDSTALLESCDSALHFLTIAKSVISEKELKKNSDFYQAFYRRDLRTGDFGIKLSDVQLDIDKKNEELNKLSKYARIIHNNLRIADRNYELSNEQYRHLSTLYPNENDFALMCNDLEQDALQGMVMRTDSINNAIDEVRDAVSKLGRKGYSPEINFVEINEFGADGKSKADFYQNDIVVWNYSSWAENLQSKIRMDVNRMRDRLNESYTVLKEKYDRAKSGSGITESELAQSVNPELKKQLGKLDENPLPEKLLSVLIEETKFEFITDKRLNTRLADEGDVNYQLVITDSINSIIENITEKASALVEPYTTTGAKKYPAFIEQNYGGEVGLIKHRQSIEKKFAAEKIKWQESQAYWTGKSKWGVSEDGIDSIYLMARTDSAYISMELSKFYTLAITEDDSSNIYALGLEFKGDIDKGYLAKIGNDRMIKWKANFDLDKFEYNDEVLQVNGGYAPTSEGKVAGYIYSNVAESENNFILFNCDQQEGVLNWSTAVKTTREPVSIKFNDIVMETNVFLMNEEALETYEGDDPIYIVFDRKGTKVR